MTTSSLNTALLHRQIERIRSGDRAAQEELIHLIAGRMERMAQSMLRGYPTVRLYADADDVFQNAIMRLLAALRTIRPDSTRDFFNLAAAQVRRELLDLSRHFARRRVELPRDGPDAEERPNATDLVPDPGPRPDRLELWQRLHQSIETLPVEERETVCLAYYHGLTHQQIAEILDVTDRSVRRYWRSACERLNATLGEGLEELLA